MDATKNLMQKGIVSNIITKRYLNTTQMKDFVLLEAAKGSSMPRVYARNIIATLNSQKICKIVKKWS